MLFAAVSILLISFDNKDFTTTVTAVIATMNNIGPGLGLVGPTGSFADFSALSKKIVMSIGMLVGRLEFFIRYLYCFRRMRGNELKESDDSSENYIGRCDFLSIFWRKQINYEYYQKNFISLKE